jgi:Secretion system C-terminal sorting domain
MGQKSVGLVILMVLGHAMAFSQTCNPGGPSGTFSFFTECIGSAPYNDPDNYTITIGNNKTIEINGNVTIAGTLTINLVGSTSRLVIKSGFTLSALNITFSGSATGKQIEVESTAAINVSGTLDFGDLNLDIDGAGTISAGTITGADNTLCANDSNCPIITANTCDDGTGNFCDTSLPIELVSFDAKVSFGKIDISWVTASELNFDHFLLEKSSNGNEFTGIAQIQGHGTTNERHSYGFEDRFPMLGKSYYRLTSVDFDGYTESFDILSVVYHGEKSARVYPNPAVDGKINIELSFAPSEPVNVVVTDLNGVEKGRAKAEGKAVSFSTELNPGTYLVKISTGDFSKVMRVVVR